MTNSFKRKLAFYFISFILAFMLVSIVTCVAKGQEPIRSTIGIENAMTDIPDGYYLSKSDTVKCIMIVSSKTWYDGPESLSSFEPPRSNFRPGYVVTQKHRFKRDRHARYVMYFNRVLLHKLVFLDTKKNELKNQIVWDYRIVKEQTDLEKAMGAEPISIIGKTSAELFPEPTVRDFRTPQYDSSQYVRIAEFQELKQKLNDQKEAYRRELMAQVLARFCTFMSPEKAAMEAVKYADGLIKELEK